MKKLYTYITGLLILFTAMSGCRRQEFEYGIVAEFPRFFRSELKKCFLVITDLDNNVLVEKEITDFTTNTLFHTFTLRLKTPVELFNAHIIVEDPSGFSSNKVNIYSHLGLKNSGSFKIMPDTDAFVTPPSSRLVKINLGLNNKLYSYHFVGTPVNSLSFAPDVIYEAIMQNGQGLVIVRDDIGTSEKKYFYIPPEKIKDSLYIDSSEFTQFSKSIDYTLNIIPLGNQIQVYALSPDKKEFSHLEDNFFDIDKIIIPEDIPSNWSFYIKANLAHGQVEKEVQSDIKSVDLNPTISLKSKMYKDGVLNIQCSEGVDWVRAAGYADTDSSRFPDFYWSVEGHPDLFRHFEVPDLTPYVSDAIKARAQLYQNFSVTLIRSGEFDYEDILKGLPWKTGEPFRNGKNGLEILTIY